VTGAVAETLVDAREGIVAVHGFPPEHWRQIWSTDLEGRLIERVNKEITRRTDVVGVFPNPDAGELTGTIHIPELTAA